MSFYGTSFIELGDVIRNFKFKNPNETENEELMEINIEARNKWDTLTVIGDPWINFEPGEENKQEIIINHTSMQDIPIEEVEDKTAPRAELALYGIDAAGHSVEMTPCFVHNNYDLTRSDIEINNGDNPDFELKAGDTITIPVLNYDDSGHISECTTATYKMPISEVEVNVADLQTRMGIVESEIQDLNDNTLGILGDLTLDNYLQENYVAKDQVDEVVMEHAYIKTEIDNMFAAQALVDDSQTKAHESLVSAIGELDNIIADYETLVNSLGNLSEANTAIDGEQKLNIAEMLVRLQEQVTLNSAAVVTINLAIKGLETDIKELADRLTALETV